MKGASNFISKGLKKLRKKESTDSFWDKPARIFMTPGVVPTSQETADGEDDTGGSEHLIKHDALKAA
jgi:hypothetical protein